MKDLKTVTWLKFLQLIQVDHNVSNRVIQEKLELSRRQVQYLRFAHNNKQVLRLDHQIFKPKSKCLVLADIHIPFHDEIALQSIYGFIKQNQINTVILLGDLIDNYQLSRFSKNPAERDFRTQMIMVKQFLSNLRTLLPDATIIYKQGNHEVRLKKYIWDSASKLSNLLDDLYYQKLGLKQLNIQYLIKPFKIGKLWFLHGHQTVAKTVNPEMVTNMIYRFVNDNFMVGHFHRVQQNQFKRINGQVFFGASVGYLAKDLQYAGINKWVQGFAYVQFDENGNFKNNLYKIVNGAIY